MTRSHSLLEGEGVPGVGADLLNCLIDVTAGQRGVKRDIQDGQLKLIESNSRFVGSKALLVAAESTWLSWSIGGSWANR